VNNAASSSCTVDGIVEELVIDTPIVLIVGGLTGIGRATATVFAEQGAHVVVSGRRSVNGEALAEALCARGTQAEFIRADVRHESEVKELVAKTVERFGRLDAAVNAAETEGVYGNLVDRTPEDYASTFDTNVLGTFLSLKYELRVMQSQRSGSIVNISSTLGQRGAIGAALYAASKHAVEGLTKTAALEAAAFNVRINAIAPGPVDMGMLTRSKSREAAGIAVIASVPLKRMASPTEIARVIAFVCSPQASSVTGQIVGVDGGTMAC
jgi:NAD(P)-dependent dehydrogenase (short-subunit alcohol dehydrogenase family)